MSEGGEGPDRECKAYRSREGLWEIQLTRDGERWLALLSLISFPGPPRRFGLTSLVLGLLMGSCEEV